MSSTAPTTTAINAASAPTSTSAASPAALDPASASGRLASAVLGPLAQRLLDGIRTRTAVGRMSVTLPDGRRIVGGSPGAATSPADPVDARDGSGSVPTPSRVPAAAATDAAIEFKRWRGLLRLISHGDLGLAAGYRAGEWSTPDLTALLVCAARNEASWSASARARGPMAVVARGVSRIAHARRANTRAGSRRNIAFHYDLGNDFYRQWLDADMVYSSALFSHESQTLAEGQAAKLARVRHLLKAQPGEQVLEIGCGWGALATTIAERDGASVTGVTLSREQLDWANRRVLERGQSPRVSLRLEDYRDTAGTFDRIVSIEMIEAVGERYWPQYFRTIAERLRPGGRAVIQSITIDPAYFARYREEPDFIQRTVFPGGMLPTAARIADEASAAGLRLVAMESFGDSYARTLAIWRERFDASWPTIAALGFDERFRRLWRYYLSYCEAGFLTRRVNVGLFVLEHQPTTRPKSA